jgi:hypothetical protein
MEKYEAACEVRNEEVQVMNELLSYLRVIILGKSKVRKMQCSVLVSCSDSLPASGVTAEANACR